MTSTRDSIGRHALLPFAALLISLGLAGCAGSSTAVHINESANLIMSGEYTKAVSEATSAIQLKPDSNHAYINRAIAYQSLRNFEAAAADYKRAIDLAPDEAITRYNYVLLLRFMRKPAKAEAHARGFLKTHPKSILGNLALAEALEASGDYEAGYRVIAQRVPDLAVNYRGEGGEFESVPKERMLAAAYGTLSRLAARVGREKEAWDAIRKMSSYLPDDSSRSLAKAQVFAILGRHEEAIRGFDQAFRGMTAEEAGSPDVNEAKFVMGNLYFKIGNMEEAKKAYESFISVNPFEPEAYVNLAQAHARLGDSTRAIENYNEALRLKPQQELALENRGTLYLQHGRYAEAIRDFTAALERHPDNLQLLYKRAYALCSGGESAGGRRDLKRILRSDPSHQDASSLLSYCESN